MSDLDEFVTVQRWRLKQATDIGFAAGQGEAAAEIERLRAERDRLLFERNEAFRMSKCECGPDEVCANLVRARAEVEALRHSLLHAASYIDELGGESSEYRAALRGKE
jgi:hypothetical protein